MKKQVVTSALLGCAVFCTLKGQAQTDEMYVKVPITWVDTIPGDFSFKDKWQYRLSVSRDKWGQLVRYHQPNLPLPDAFEPDGHLKKDSVTAYYAKTDTSHYYYNTYWYSNCFEYRTESADVLHVRVTPGNIHCTNSFTATSNCKFRMDIGTDSCRMSSTIVDVIPADDVYYNGFSGSIKIDRRAWMEGILIAEFNFNFRHPYNPEITHFWKGLLYIPLKDKSKPLPPFGG